VTQRATEASDLMATARALQLEVGRQARQFLHPFNLTIPQYRTLVHIARAAGDGPITVGALGRHLGVACSTASGIVDRLERDRLVTRCRQPPDRRTVRIEATPRARKIVDQEVVSLESYWTRVLEAMGGRERNAVLIDLRRLREAMQDVSVAGEGRPRDEGEAARRAREGLRDLWREEVAAAGRYFVAAQLAQGYPAAVAHLSQMGREKIDHAVELRRRMGRSPSPLRYAERLDNLSRQRRGLKAGLLAAGALNADMADFLRRASRDEERHETWLQQIRRTLESEKGSAPPTV